MRWHLGVWVWFMAGRFQTQRMSLQFWGKGGGEHGRIVWEPSALGNNDDGSLFAITWDSVASCWPKGDDAWCSRRRY